MISLCYLLLISIQTIICVNIDTKYPIVFTYDKLETKDHNFINGSYFGYSLSVYQTNGENTLLIGAPKHQSKLYSGTDRTGAIFLCRWRDSKRNDRTSCEEINFNNFNPKSNRHLGSSLASLSSTFVGCDHLWLSGLNSIEPSPVGKCYLIDINGRVGTAFGPSDTPRLVDGRPLRSHLMYGFSSITSQAIDSTTRDLTLTLGAPGYRDFSGAIVNQINPNNDGHIVELEKVIADSRRPSVNGYLGYSITTGFFDGRETSEYVVMGAPRHDSFKGKVLIFPLSALSDRNNRDFQNSLIEVKPFPGTESSGEYFGASLLTLDLNNDKFDDLIVSAPFYSNDRNREIGRIFVFMSTTDTQDDLFHKEIIRVGFKSESRFGTAMSSLDINRDDFKDAIISAPYESNSDGSLGAVYIYFGLKGGIDSKPTRIGAENVGNVGLNGFGISIASNIDFDLNGYNDLLIGSYLSENVVLLRSKPIANLSVSDIRFKPNKIRLNEKSVNNNPMFAIEYCVGYEGMGIKSPQTAIITLDITDGISRVRKIRAKINKMKTFERIVELKANQQNCFRNDKSFLGITVEDQDKIDDINSPIEVKLTVQLTNDTSNEFCKTCAFAETYYTFSNISFDHSCGSSNCLSQLTLTAVPKYNGHTIDRKLTEGFQDTIDVEISVANSGDAATDTAVTIEMSPILLELIDDAEATRCRKVSDNSSYRCDVLRVLRRNGAESLNLHFNVTRIASNSLEMRFNVVTTSKVHQRSKLSQSMNIEIIREADLMLKGETANNFSYSDKTPKVSFDISYSLIKTGPSAIDNAFLRLRLPTDIIVPNKDSQSSVCRKTMGGNRYNDIPIVNKTLHLVCEESTQYCSEYECRLPQFNSPKGSVFPQSSQQFILSLALIPSKIKSKKFNEIKFTLNSEIKIRDNVKFEKEISSSASMSIFMAREVPIVDEVVEPWVLFTSAGFGVFILIITIIILIKYGFFRRKKLEEIQKVKQRMSMRPEMMDINDLDLDEEELK